jgi:Sel1 repeat
MRHAINTTLVALFLALGFSAPVAAGPFEDGLAAFHRGDYATALRLWRPLAVQGDAPAQSYLGFMYAGGRGVPRDYAEAETWFRRAAAQGDAAAQSNLGIMYYHGQGVPQDFPAALTWFRIAADKGTTFAQYNLGLMYTNGQGVPRDYGEAVTWFRKAAAQGDAPAQYNLGVMYAKGLGLPQDYGEVELTRLGGHRTPWGEEGVHDAQDATALCPAAPGAARRAGPNGADAGGVGPAVRTVRPDHPELAAPSRSG